MNHLSPRAVIFDFDGTLIDSAATIVETFNSVLRRYGVAEWEPVRVRRMIGRPLDELFRSAFGIKGPDPALLVAEYARQSRKQGYQKIRQLPGAAETLQRLSSEEVGMAIATSRSVDSTRRILNRFGWSDHFSAVIGIDVVEHPKPHPEPVQAALGHLEVETVDALLVGDTPDDIQAARSAGVAAIGVTTGAHLREQLEAAGALRVVHSLSELLRLLD